MLPRQWRPSWPRYLAFSKAGIVVVSVIAAAGVVAFAISRSAGEALLPIEVVVVGTGGIAFASQALRVRRTTLEVDDDWVSWRGVSTRCRLRRGPHLQGLLAPIRQPGSTSLMTLILTDGRQRLQLVGGLWSEDDLAQIAAELGLPTTYEPIRLREVERQAPGATTVLGRHPWWRWSWWSRSPMTRTAVADGATRPISPARHTSPRRR